MADSILTVSDLNVSFLDRSKGLFGKKKQIHVLKDISFEMKQGEILGLVGESGSGKSTLAKSILGLLPFEGEIVHTSEYPQMVFQDPYGSLNPAKKVGWILEEPLRLRGNLSENERKEKVLSMLHKVGLDDKFLERYPSQLSGGQRQRLTVARALVRRPDILILDDSSSALDYATEAAMRTSIREATAGSTVVIVSQRASSVMHASKIIVLEDGEAVGIGTHGELLRDCPIYREIYETQFGEGDGNG